MAAKYKPEGPPPVKAWPFAQVWSRDGSLLHDLGPGAVAPEAEEAQVTNMSSPRSAVVNDTVLFFPLGGRGWLGRWTPTVVDTLPVPDSLWVTLGLVGDKAPKEGSLPTAVKADGGGGVWVLGGVRRLSEEEEEGLVGRAPQPGIETMDYYKRATAFVRNAVYDGFLVHVTKGGSVTAGVVFEEYPFGFSGPGEFYTFDEDENVGLIRIRIWKFAGD
jgi:hypothetical protein